MSSSQISRNNSRTSEEGATSSQYVAKLVQEFTMGEFLGSGGFGEIYKVTRRSDNNEFAIKIIKFESNMEDVGKYRREAENLFKLNHNNIVRYYNSWIETAQIPKTMCQNLKADSESPLSSEIYELSENGYLSNESIGDNDEEVYCDEDDDDVEEEDGDSVVSFQAVPIDIKKYLFIQMELCEKRTLRTAIDSDLYLDEDKLTKYFREICEGLLHIHKNGIVHRDLKPENIFLTTGDMIKIGDFGLSKQIFLANDLEDGNLASNIPLYGSLTDACGTGIYIAPELFDSDFFTVKADMYSLGVIYFEMCTKPMTVMEKLKIFPLTSVKLKNINCLKRGSTKSYLIKNLLHQNCNERPTCENILEILNSQKSLSEIKEMIQREKKVPFQQLKAFEKILKTNDIKKIDVISCFMKKAVEIFELHGALNISGVTFLPPFNRDSTHLTTLLNIRGNSVSVSDSSRIAVLHYMKKNKIKAIRRYSTGKVFEEGYYLPTEKQECVFEAIGSEGEDYVTFAEVVYVAEEICNEIFGSDIPSGLQIYVNHRLIYSTILKHFEIVEEDATVFTNEMIKLTKKLTVRSNLSSRYEHKKHLQNCIRNMWTPYNFRKAQEEIFAKLNRRNKSLNMVFNKLEIIVNNIIKFGIKPENIFVAPLLITEKRCPGFMFKVEKSQMVIATGETFVEPLIMSRKKGQKQEKLSGIGISFNIENILETWNCGVTAQTVDVVIIATEKTMTIPLFKKLLSWKMKCQVLKEFDLSASDIYPSFVITLHTEDICVVRKPMMNNKLIPVYNGNWKSVEFSYIIQRRLNLCQQNDLSWARMMSPLSPWTWRGEQSLSLRDAGYD